MENKEPLRKLIPHRRLQLADTTLKKYGLSRQTANDLFTAQNCVCAICFVDTRMVVDHCHTTRRIRGFLCTNCNILLGMCADTPAILESAIRYLRQSEGIEIPKSAEASKSDEALDAVMVDESLKTDSARARALAAKLKIGEDAARSRIRRWSKNAVHRGEQ